MNLVRGELLKIRTTNLWWVFALCAFAMQALAFLSNSVNAHSQLAGDLAEGVPPEVADTVAAQSSIGYIAADLYTSGQFFGLLFVMVLGILLVTNEFHHQTATTTFLTTPNRTAVIGAKLATASLLGALFWLVSTLINIPVTAIFLAAEDQSSHLGDGAIVRAISLNLLAYLLWGIFGVGFGVLIRSQIGATVTAVVLYLAGTGAAAIFFALMRTALDKEWIAELQVLVPSIASNLMITGASVPGDPPQWVGAAVLITYAVLTGVIGTAIMRHRDIT